MFRPPASSSGLQFSSYQMPRLGAGLSPELLWASATTMGTYPGSQLWMSDHAYPRQLSKDKFNFDFEVPDEQLGYGKMFKKGAILIGGFEFVVMATMMVLPKSFTGWQDDFIQDGANNFRDAYSAPPSWDQDHWYHNYLGHPYVGSIYYNTVRCQGASPVQSFFFSAAMSVWWEYAVEAIAEHPSTQDLLVTPITGALLGEAVHHMTVSWLKDGEASLGQKIIIFVLNPTHVVLLGF